MPAGSGYGEALVLVAECLLLIDPHVMEGGWKALWVGLFYKGTNRIHEGSTHIT